MVEFENAGFAFGATEVLHDVNLTVEPGSFWVVYGRRGSGKTTLVRACRGDVVPTEGEVRVLGGPVPFGNRNGLARLRRRVGLVEENNRFLDHLPVEDNVAAPLMADGTSGGRSEDIAALLAWVGLGEQARHRPCDLAPGDKRLVALARAVIGSPDLLLADDPAGGLPVDRAFELMNFFVELNRMGTTVFLTSSDSEVVDFLISARPIRVAHLVDGQLEVLE